MELFCYRHLTGLLAVFCIACGQRFGGPEIKPTLFSDGKTLAQVVVDGTGKMLHCKLHELEEETDAAALIAGSGLVTHYPNFKDMLNLINDCTRLEKPTNGVSDSADANATSSTDYSWVTWPIWNGIMPGTKWCGVGDIAESFEQLGSETELDACCRAHDHCPVKLKAFRAGYGLINLSLYTKSHCDCDRDFFQCLKTSENRFSDMVGNFYFNVMKLQCLRQKRPAVCIENVKDNDIGVERCTDWTEDTNSKDMQVVSTQIKY